MNFRLPLLLSLLLTISSAANAQWSYQSSSDKMRGTTSTHASVVSNNSVEFEFPYGGGSSGRLALRQRPDDGLSVMFFVSKGQLTCMMGCEIAVKFDDGKVLKFSASGPEDGDSEMIFINSEKRFLSNLLASKRVIIEAPFYQAGRKQFEFTTTGLKWGVVAPTKK